VTDSARGTVGSVTVWPVKSMSGGADVERVAAEPQGLAGDREHALLDRRPLRDGRVLSARNVPGILRWRAARPDPTAPPVLTAPDGTSWCWTDPAVATALSDDLGVPVGLAPAGAHADLAASVLVTTTATHAAVEQATGRRLDAHRWRTNLTLDLDVPAFAEAAWEGRTMVVGDTVLRLLHPCKRCTIPTWEPGGTARSPELLQWFLEHTDGVFGINARV
jgi:uncharacterized protein YcbX